MVSKPESPDNSGIDLTTKSTSTLFATLMLLLLCVFWGMTFPATRAALRVTNPLHFLALRFALAVIIATPFMALRRIHGEDRHRKTLAAHPKELMEAWLRGAWVGLLLFGGFALQVIGLRYTTASRSGFFTGLLVVMVPPLAYIFRTSRMPFLTWLGIPVAIFGIYLLADPHTGGLNLGDWLTIACALTFALQMVALEAAARHVKDTWLLTYVQMFIVTTGAAVWCLVEGIPFQMEKAGWIALIYTAVFGSLAATWMQTKFQPQVPAGHAALIFMAEPVFASLFAWMLLGEGWTSRGVIGASVILIAMVISSLAVRRST